jgi:tetratricopeptide (TPR) repeat protein
MPNDTAKLEALYQLATNLPQTDSARAYAYAGELLSISNELNNPKGVGKAWQARGVIAYNLHSFQLAVSYFEKATSFFKDINHSRGTMICYWWMARCHRRSANYPGYARALTLLEIVAKLRNDKEYLGYAYEGFGNLYRYLGKYPLSIENYTKAIKLAEERGDLHDISVALNNMSLVYGMLGQSKEELKLELRNYAIVKEMKDSASMVLVQSNLAGLYATMKQMDSAWHYINMAMEIIRMKGEDNLFFKDVASVYGQYANLSSGKKDYKTAIEYENKNVNLSRKNGDIKTVSDGYNSLAGIFLLMGNKGLAEEYFLKSLDITTQIGYINGQVSNYQALADLYFDQKNFQKAYMHLRECSVLKDSLSRLANAEKLAEAEAMYKVQEQQHDIAMLSQDKRMQEMEIEQKKLLAYSLMAGLAFVITLSVAALRIRKKHRDQKSRFEESIGI